LVLACFLPFLPCSCFLLVVLPYSLFVLFHACFLPSLYISCLIPVFPACYLPFLRVSSLLPAFPTRSLSFLPVPYLPCLPCLLSRIVNHLAFFRNAKRIALNSRYLNHKLINNLLSHCLYKDNVLSYVYRSAKFDANFFNFFALLGILFYFTLQR